MPARQKRAGSDYQVQERRHDDKRPMTRLWKKITDLEFWRTFFTKLWANEIEQINEEDTTAACTGPYNLRATYITKMAPPKLACYFQVGLVVCNNNGQTYVSKPTQYGQTSELRFLSKCKHPYINAVVDVQHKDEKYYAIILQYHEIGDLEYYLRGQKTKCTIRPEIMLQWMKQLLEAVAHMHALGVVHCDLKPTNVLVVNPVQLCIADLGVAQTANKDGLGKYPWGTKRFLPPELKYMPNSKKSDMFGLGCVLYEAMTYSFMFDLGGTYENLVKEEKHLQELQKVSHIYPLKLRHVVEKCMHEDRHQRPSAAELLETLA
jgi:serine/threonine protein kinase